MSIFVFLSLDIYLIIHKLIIHIIFNACKLYVCTCRHYLSSIELDYMIFLVITPTLRRCSKTTCKSKLTLPTKKTYYLE